MNSERPVTLPSVTPVPPSVNDRLPLHPAGRGRPKPQPFMGEHTEDIDAFFTKGLNRKRDAPSPSLSYPNAGSAVPDKDLRTHPVLKKPRYDENIIQLKRSKRLPVPIQRPDYEPGLISKLGQYKRP